MKSRLNVVKECGTLARKAEFPPAMAALHCQFGSWNSSSCSLLAAPQLDEGTGMQVGRDFIFTGLDDKAVVSELEFGNTAHLCHEFKSFYFAPPQTFAPRQIK
jgi:hypothetical protein